MTSKMVGCVIIAKKAAHYFSKKNWGGGVDKIIS